MDPQRPDLLPKGHASRAPGPNRSFRKRGFIGHPHVSQQAGGGEQQGHILHAVHRPQKLKTWRIGLLRELRPLLELESSAERALYRSTIEAYVAARFESVKVRLPPAPSLAGVASVLRGYVSRHASESVQQVLVGELESIPKVDAAYMRQEGDHVSVRVFIPEHDDDVVDAIAALRETLAKRFKDLHLDVVATAHQGRGPSRRLARGEEQVYSRAL